MVKNIKQKSVNVSITGIGTGSRNTMTKGSDELLKKADLIIGSERIIEELSKDYSAEREALVKPFEILECIRRRGDKDNVVVAMSGDTGFYSGAKKLAPLLKESGYDVQIFPGISSVQYMASRLGKTWQDVLLVSGHGVGCNIVGSIISSEVVFFLTGGEITPGTVLKEIFESGLPCEVIYIGEKLSYDDEKIVCIYPRNIEKYICAEFDRLSCVWVERRKNIGVYKYLNTGIPDDMFARGDVPMTKQAVRSVALSKLGIEEGDVLYDIGAGTGSVSIEMALLSPNNIVYSIERDEKACRLVILNREKFGAYNVKLIKGEAPDAFRDLPTPNAAFIGGSGGRIYDALSLLKEKNAKVRVVIAAITVETLTISLESLRELEYKVVEITNVSIAVSKKVKKFNMMTSQNPIFIISAKGVVPNEQNTHCR